MLAPKRVLHRKVQRGSMKGQAKGNTQLHFGEYGLKALEAHWITNRQIEAARIAMTRYIDVYKRQNQGRSQEVRSAAARAGHGR